MYWRVKWDITNFKIIVGNDVPYWSRDFLEIDKHKLPIDENLLRYEFDPETNLSEPDFPTGLTDGVLVCTREVWDFFSTLMISNLVVYQGECDHRIFFFHCCLLELSGFDFERSRYRRFSKPDDDIEVIFDLKLRSDFRTQYDLFRLNDEWGCRRELIVSDRFRQIYTQNKFTGLLFFET